MDGMEKSTVSLLEEKKKELVIVDIFIRDAQKGVLVAWRDEK